MKAPQPHVNRDPASAALQPAKLRAQTLSQARFRIAKSPGRLRHRWVA